MGALATAGATWRTVRCPCGRATLGEARGDGSGEFRRICPKCHQPWIIRADATVRADPS